MSTPRRRGAQPGNHNARKHGLYAQVLSGEQLQALSHARELGAGSLEEEIALLRSRIAALVAAAPDRVDLLTAALRTLVQLVTAQHRLQPSDNQALAEALEGLRAMTAAIAEEEVL